ncbi:MAG: methyltransferase domain-containing protein, partial [Kineosporiaceae bacterium]
MNLAMAESPASAREPLPMLVHRLKCFVAGHYLEAVGVRLKDSPHEQLAAMVQGEDADVLEVCAATGFLSRIIATGLPHARVCALDLSAGMIAQGRVRAQGLHNLEFVNGDATAMPYADKSFDVVLAAWLRTHADQVWLFSTNLAVEWTSNAAERGVKPAKRHQAVSGYWQS